MTSAESPQGTPVETGRMTAETSDRSSLKRAAIRSSAWALTGFGGAQSMRFVSNVVFAYLLYEEAFALMMLVNAVVQGLQMFSDIGIGPSIVQHKRGAERRFLGTAYTLQVLRGGILAVVCWLLTHPIASFYAANDPAAWDLERLLPYAALTVVIGGFGSMRLHTASRDLSIGRVVRIDLISQVVGIVTTVVWALASRDVLALMMGGLAATTCKTVLSHIVLPGERDHFAWDPAAARAIFSFGGWIFVSTVTSFFAMQIDRLVFAGSFELKDAGVFHVAVSIAAMLPMVIGSLQLAVVFPLYSRLQNQGDEIMPVLIRVKGAVFTISSVLVACMVAGGPPFVEFVYDDRWLDAGWMVSLLALGGWFSIVESLYGAAMLARGKAQWVAISNAAKPIVFLTIYLVGGDRLTIPDVVLASVVADVAKGLLSMWGASRIGVLTLGLDLRATTKMLAVAGAAWALQWYLDDLGAHPVLILAAIAALCFGVFGPSLLASARVLRNRPSQS